MSEQTLYAEVYGECPCPHDLNWWIGSSWCDKCGVRAAFSRSGKVGVVWLVPVEPVGTLTVEKGELTVKATKDVVLRQGKYLIVEVDDD